MIGYANNFDSNKTMSFKVGDDKLLKRYNKIWDRVSNLINIKFDSEPVYFDNDKYIKTKIQLYGGEVYTNFQGKKLPKENASYKCVSLTILESVIRANKKCYPQTLLVECKYLIRKNKMGNFVNDDLSSSDESDNESDNEVDSEVDSDESSD